MMNRIKINLFKITLKFFSKDTARYFFDFLMFSVGFIISSLLALFITINVNKNLSKHELGEFNYIKSFLEFFTFVFTLLLYRSYLRFNVSGLNLSLFKKIKWVSFLAYILLSFLAYYLTRSLLSLLFPFFIFYEERLYFFRSLMKVSVVNKLKILVALVTLITVIIFVKFNCLNSVNVLFCYGIGFLISLFFYFKKINFKQNLDVLPWKKILLFSLPNLGAVIVKTLLDLSCQFLIKNNFGFVELSKYAIANRVLLSMKLFSSLLMMFYPVVYYREIKKKNKSFLIKVRLVILGVIFIVAFFAIVFNKSIYFLMGASEYVSDVGIYNILVISEVFFLIGSLWGVFLSYNIKTYISLIIYFLGCLLNLILLAVLLKKEGVYAAPKSILVANIFIAMLMVIFSVKGEKKILNDE